MTRRRGYWTMGCGSRRRSDDGRSLKASAAAGMHVARPAAPVTPTASCRPARRVCTHVSCGVRAPPTDNPSMPRSRMWSETLLAL
jgi:hypothetical protein